jgi:hypothetical protein
MGFMGNCTHKGNYLTSRDAVGTQHGRHRCMEGGAESDTTRGRCVENMVSSFQVCINVTDLELRSEKIE